MSPEQQITSAISGNLADQFFEKGFLDPVPVLTPAACRQFLVEAGNPERAAPVQWDKGHAVSSRAFYKVATTPRIIEILRNLLGNDVMLWGAQIVNRPPDARHPWHTDIETSDPQGKTVTVWIGLENTRSGSGLTIAPHSHLFGKTIQEVRARSGKSRRDTTDEDVAEWAHSLHPGGNVTCISSTDGEALIYDGRLWHASHNRTQDTRRALLLQYAAIDTRIRMPDYTQLDWPFKFLADPAPPCLLVSGSDYAHVNQIFAPPLARAEPVKPPSRSIVHPLNIPLPPAQNEFWEPHPLFHGSTPNVADLSCHVSTLHPGHRPHPPHTHDEEEILMLLDGEAIAILPDATDEAAQHLPLQPGQFVYYPAGFSHTLESTGIVPANYLMLRWKGPDPGRPAPLLFNHFTIFDQQPNRSDMEGFIARLLFEGPTRYLSKLHCHSSTISPGSGYDVHCDDHDIVIIVLEGEVETLGKRATPHGAIFYRAGEPHGMFNPGETVARYVVFEFHST